MDPIHLYYIHIYVYAPIWSSTHNIYLYMYYMHTGMLTYMRPYILAYTYTCELFSEAHLCG